MTNIKDPKYIEADLISIEEMEKETGRVEQFDVFNNFEELWHESVDEELDEGE